MVLLVLGFTVTTAFAASKPTIAVPPACIVVEPGVAIDGVRLGDAKPELVTPINFEPGERHWWQSVGQTRIGVNADGIVDIVEHPITPADTCLLLEAGGQTARIAITADACAEIPFDGCSAGRFGERMSELWDCGDSGFQWMKDAAHGIRVVPAEHAPVWNPPPELTPEGCSPGLAYEPTAEVYDSHIKLPRGTIGMRDSWSGHTGVYLCTPGANEATIQPAIEKSFRNAGYAEVKPNTDTLQSVDACSPEHVWSNGVHTYSFKVPGGARWEITSCPRCEWEEQRAKARPADPPK